MIFSTTVSTTRTPCHTAMKLINLFRLQAYCLGDTHILGFYFAIKFVVLIMRISNLKKKKIQLHSWRGVFHKILKMLKVLILVYCKVQCKKIRKINEYKQKIFYVYNTMSDPTEYRRSTTLGWWEHARFLETLQVLIN